MQAERLIMYSQRDTIIIAKALASGRYPIQDCRLSVSLAELDAALTRASHARQAHAEIQNSLINTFREFCTDDNGEDFAGDSGEQLWAAVRRANPMADIPDILADVYGWQLYDLREARKPRPPLEYVVSGMLAKPSLNIVYGSPGSLKSMLMADCAVCVAGGLPWLTPVSGQEDEVSPIATLPMPVLWVDYDNGKRRTDERIDALDRARRLTDAAKLYYAVMPDPWLDASDPERVRALSWRVRDLGIGLVVIDNLGAVSGEADENSASMGRVMANFRNLVEETNTCVVIIHHQRKSTGFGRMGEDLRGHSSIRASLDLALLVEREEHNPTISLRSTKTRGVDVYPFGALWTYEHAPGTKDLHQARFFGSAVVDDSSLAAIEQAILDAVGDTAGIKQKDLIDATKDFLPGAGLNKIRNHIVFMTDAGKLTIKTELNNAKTYYLPVKD